MHITIADRNADTAYAALGLSEERAHELSRQLSEIFNGQFGNKNFRLSNMFEACAELSQTNEELVYTVHLVTVSTRWGYT